MDFNPQNRWAAHLVWLVAVMLFVLFLVQLHVLAVKAAEPTLADVFVGRWVGTIHETENLVFAGVCGVGDVAAVLRRDENGGATGPFAAFFSNPACNTRGMVTVTALPVGSALVRLHTASPTCVMTLHGDTRPGRLVGRYSSVGCPADYRGFARLFKPVERPANHVDLGRTSAD